MEQEFTKEFKKEFPKEFTKDLNEGLMSTNHISCRACHTFPCPHFICNLSPDCLCNSPSESEDSTALSDPFAFFLCYFREDAFFSIQLILPQHKLVYLFFSSSCDLSTVFYSVTGNDVRNNDTWIKIAKDEKGWQKMEREFAVTAAASPGNRRQRGRWMDQHDEHLQLVARSARYVNGVMLEDSELMNSG